MAVFQLLWLVGIVVTGASTRYEMIFILAIFSIVATIAIIILPESAIPKLRDLKSWLLEGENWPLLWLCLIALLIGLVYSFRPDLGGDELSSVRAANVIAAKGIAAAYERIGWLGGQHPPLFPLLFSLTVQLPGPDLLFMRMLSVVFLAGAVSVTYVLGRELYGREIGYLAAILLLSFPLVVRLSASAMMDIQLTFFFSLAVLLLIRLSRNPSYRLACAAGLVIGVGLLTKYIMALVFVVLFLYFIFLKSFRSIRPHLFIVAMISLSIFAAWLLYANQMGVLDRQILRIMNFMGIYHVVRDVEQATLSTQPAETEQESSDPAERMQNGIFRLGLESLFTRIPSSLGMYHAPLIFFGLFYLVKKRDPVDLMLLLWMGGVSLTLFLTLPDHRYFLPVFPAIAIAIAHLLLRFPQYAGRAVLLSLLFGIGNLYLFANWVRESHLFIIPH